MTWGTRSTPRPCLRYPSKSEGSTSGSTPGVSAGGSSGGGVSPVKPRNAPQLLRVLSSLGLFRIDARYPTCSFSSGSVRRDVGVDEDDELPFLLLLPSPPPLPRAVPAREEKRDDDDMLTRGRTPRCAVLFKGAGAAAGAYARKNDHQEAVSL